MIVKSKLGPFYIRKKLTDDIHENGYTFIKKYGLIKPYELYDKTVIYLCFDWDPDRELVTISDKETGLIIDEVFGDITYAIAYLTEEKIKQISEMLDSMECGRYRNELTHYKFR